MVFRLLRLLWIKLLELLFNLFIYNRSVIIWAFIMVLDGFINCFLFFLGIDKASWSVFFPGCVKVPSFCWGFYFCLVWRSHLLNPFWSPAPNFEQYFIIILTSLLPVDLLIILITILEFALFWVLYFDGIWNLESLHFNPDILNWHSLKSFTKNFDIYRRHYFVKEALFYHLLALY